MWDSFVPDLLVALIGAFLTVAIAYLTYLLKVRHDEQLAAQSLINELHRRRALRPTLVRTIPGAADSDDFIRVHRSIATIRREIRSTRDRTRPVDKLQRPLSDMTRACNRYLSRSAASPDDYVIHLEELRHELADSIHTLVSAKRGLVALEPGAGAS